jgi:hypothetical protein
MVFHTEISFPEKLPSIGAVVAQLSLNTGLNIAYYKNRQCLISETLDAFIDFYQGELNEYCIHIFDVEDIKLIYLVNATVHALLQLGGQSEFELSKLAGLDWKLAKLVM